MPSPESSGAMGGRGHRRAGAGPQQTKLQPKEMAALLPLLLLVLGACGAVSAGDVMHGITFGTGPLSAPTAGGPLSNTSDAALTALAATGATWVQLHPVFLAASVAEPGPLVPAPGSPNTPELAHLLTRAHSLGLQVFPVPQRHSPLNTTSSTSPAPLPCPSPLPQRCCWRRWCM